MGEGEVNPTELRHHPDNWRIHTPEQEQALGTVLDKVGFVQRIVVNRTTGRIVDGHLRADMALRRKEPSVPVVFVELDPDEEKLVLATLDPIGAMAGTDGEKLEVILRDLPNMGAEVDALLAKIGADAGVMPPDFQPVGADTQGRLDEKNPITCPECGHEFTP